jgi:hypothetical protein
MKRNLTMKFLTSCLTFLVLLFVGYTQDNLSFTSKRELAFENLRGETLKVRKKEAPLKVNGPPYSRAYSWSIMNFASKVFWLGEEEYFEMANAALVENSDYYLQSEKARNNRDSFYWSAEEMSRLIRFYGSKGSKRRELITRETELKIFELMWIWSKENSKMIHSETVESKSWKVYGSENHHMQHFSSCWNFADLLRSEPLYKNKKYDDGFSAEQHFKAWTEYSKVWISERAQKGLFVEIACGGYNTQTLKGLHSFPTVSTKLNKSTCF